MTWGVDSLDPWGVALPVPVRQDESPSLQVLGASSLALWMRDLDSDQGSETETLLLRYQVSSENPWLSLAGRCIQRPVEERNSDEICYLYSP